MLGKQLKMTGIVLKEVGGDLVINVVQDSTIIGRGQFLQITDKRVSRSHALLEVKDEKLYITPTHTNPCFLRTKVSKEQSVLARDVKHLLSDGDEFGLLPDQLFYQVVYPQLNGKGSELAQVIGRQEDGKTFVKGEDIKSDTFSNGSTENPQTKANESVDEKDSKGVEEREHDKSITEKGNNKEKEEADALANNDDDDDHDHEGMALPVEKKRILPDWMVKAANQESPKKVKPSPKKPMPVVANKSSMGLKPQRPCLDEEDVDDDDHDDDNDDEYTPKKLKKGKKGKDSDVDYEDDGSDDDYTPEKHVVRRGRGRGTKRRKGSDSEEDDFSDDDDDYTPRKSKVKKTPRGRSKKKTTVKKRLGRAAKTATSRSISRKKKSDDEDDDILPSRRDDDDEEEEEDGKPSRRPQRAAKQKRGSYVDDDLIEEELEDFASEEEVVEDKDSDFELEGIEDSGSDWEKSASKAPKPRGRVVAGRTPSKGRGGGVKKRGRRYSKPMDSEDDDEDIMEDDEPYVPRPSKRRGGQLSQDTEESDEDGQKKKRRREPCQYGKKCYRKNPVHFRTYCHPGDSSYDEDDKGESPSKEVRKEKEASRASPEKHTRPQRSTAGTKLVTHGTEEDEDLPDTYDYQDSFIDDGTQPSDGDGEDDSDYDAEEDIKGLRNEAKAFVRAKKS